MRRAVRSATASGTDLRAHWRDARYCAIDVETTGLDLRRDSVVSIGCAGITDGRVVCSDSYYSLIRPACTVSVALGPSHPCTTFDKWRELYLVDDGYNIIDTILTFFLLRRAPLAARSNRNAAWPATRASCQRLGRCPQCGLSVVNPAAY